MGLSKTIWSQPVELLRTQSPDKPVMFFAPTVLQSTARRFLKGFPGTVMYAVKCNPDEMVIQNLVAAGIRGFDVASVPEIEMIRRLAPTAAIHYNNPVRARSEIVHGVEAEVRSWAVDSRSELAKLIELVPVAFEKGPTEVSVRYKLPVPGAAYDFGTKFGADCDLAAELLASVAAAGFVPCLTFHPGAQCTDAAAWESYIHAGAAIARQAGVRVARINIGGGFPSHRRVDEPPAYEQIFARIDAAVSEAWGAETRPELLCEPGRALVADAFTLATQVRALRDGVHVFLNDGSYGTLAEFRTVGLIDRIDVIAPDGSRRSGAPVPRAVFGPTCDSVDRLPGLVPLPEDLEEGDYVIFHGMGAYSTATVTRSNGFGEVQQATTLGLR